MKPKENKTSCGKWGTKIMDNLCSAKIVLKKKKDEVNILSYKQILKEHFCYLNNIKIYEMLFHNENDP